MVTHTLVFSFPADMTEADRDRFFQEGSALVLGSGLAESYEHRRHIPLVDDVGEVLAPVFVASAIAQVRCRDLDAMRRLFAYPALGAFVQRWQRQFPYQAVTINSQD
ncbi:hypothetical protein [Streptacidiphilus sp. P02-A3a]|uniref:hypothetical protein n=1 Tax=Streptacidiphilus sp. P02-A3a TaxID=2704468 RepID=UPI0015FD045B|nr:hypothetical protein [Streptacidiphilus sp. P02-A3a]QMU67345.1 hypothetical protein GXP74_03095 [Streptacidiphilus sp. P02-A3a]